MNQVIMAFWILTSIIPQDRFLLKGFIRDADTGAPIVGAHVVSRNRQGITDAEGRFEIEVNIGDKLTFTHIAYMAHSHVVEDSNPLNILLHFNETELEEFTVSSFPSEEKLKQLILDTPYIPSQLESNLTNNLNFVKNIYRLGNHHTQNSIANTAKRMAAGNGEATFFSTNPSMGIMGLIRSFRKQSYIPMEKPGAPKYRLDFDKLRRARNDSTVRYSDYFE
ncbi:hypothetical protein KIH41_04180 [Litoribacter ruber]|uniref:hypothetical protein n=1 Tax=Litoribacter ruber TaxID=702568 RepID=UPI001BDA6278|nr:hypothetical protein [Litoribacter ruber]MBT0810473.1 hypothetical protein [Litoribacter ruber]